ncbi:hypothetical protein D3C73_1243050 [compost metagenome]
MEDVEFISELIFSLIERTELTATDKDLDQYYEKFSKDKDIDWENIESEFIKTTDFMSSLNLSYEEYKIYGVSHLYGIWCFSMSCILNSISVEKVAPKLIQFFSMIRDRNYVHPIVQEYKQSMSNRTKFKGQRSKRRKALVDYCC